MMHHFRYKGVILFFLLFSFLKLSAQDLNFGIGIGGMDRDRVEDLTTDRDGNIYVTGNFLGNTDFDGGEDTLLLEAEGSTAVFIAKYNKTGEVIWAKALQCLEGYSTGQFIEVDDEGNIYLAGAIRETIDFDPGEEEYLLTGGTNPDIFVAKYDSLGDLSWAFAITGSFNSDELYAMKLDQENNMYISGFVQASMDFDPGEGVAMLPSSGITGFIAQYTSDGEYLYAGSIYGARIRAIEVDSQNNVYLAGTYSSSADLDVGMGSFRVSSQGNRDWFLTRYRAGFDFDWGFSIGNVQNDDLYEMCLMDDQQIIVSGTYYNVVNINPDGGAEELQSKGSADVFMIAYDSTGTLQWHKSIGGGSYDDVMDMLIDKENNIVITGSYQEAIDMDPGEDDIYLPLMGLGTTYLGKYAADGNYKAAYSLRSQSGASILAMCSDPGDNLLVAGTYSGSVDLNLGSGVSMLAQSGTVYDSFLAGYFLNAEEPSDTGSITFNEDMVKDIHPEAGSSPAHLISCNDELFFIADDGSHGRELWKSDGTEEGTRMVMDIYPDGDAFADDPGFVVFDNRLFFIPESKEYGTELWVCGEDTRMVKDIFQEGDGCGSFTHYAPAGDYLYFTARDASGIELWKTDGETGNTMQVKDIHPDGDGVLSRLAYFQNALYFFADDGSTGPRLWSSDGTGTGTLPFYAFPGNPYAFGEAELFVADSLLYIGLYGTETGGELWCTDGSTAGTQLLKAFSPNEHADGPANFAQTGNFVFFTAFDDAWGKELWKTEGTAESTMLVSDINAAGSGIPGDAELISVNNELYFTGEDELFGLELWKTDGFDSTTRVLANINPGSDAYPGSLMEYNDEVFFAADNGQNWSLWRSREYGVDVQALRGLHSPDNKAPEWITYCRGIIFFTADDGNSGSELWKYTMVEDIGVAPEDSMHITGGEIDSLHYLFNIYGTGAGSKSAAGSESAAADPIKLLGSCYPDNATDTSLIWSVFDGEELASIDAEGKLSLSAQLVAGDTVTVLVQSDDGSKRYRKIYVVSDTTSITSLDPPAQLDQEPFGLLLYPNPVSDRLHIVTLLQNSHIEVYDISGRRQEVPFENDGDSFVLDTATLPDGVYFLRVVGDSGALSGRFVK